MDILSSFTPNQMNAVRNLCGGDSDFYLRIPWNNALKEIVIDLVSLRTKKKQEGVIKDDDYLPIPPDISIKFNQTMLSAVCDAEYEGLDNEIRGVSYVKDSFNALVGLRRIYLGQGIKFGEVQARSIFQGYCRLFESILSSWIRGDNYSSFETNPDPDNFPNYRHIPLMIVKIIIGYFSFSNSSHSKVPLIQFYNGLSCIFNFISIKNDMNAYCISIIKAGIEKNQIKPHHIVLKSEFGNPHIHFGRVLLCEKRFQFVEDMGCLSELNDLEFGS